jgi:hypothetical protein
MAILVISRGNQRPRNKRQSGISEVDAAPLVQGKQRLRTKILFRNYFRERSQSSVGRICVSGEYSVLSREDDES